MCVFVNARGFIYENHKVRFRIFFSLKTRSTECKESLNMNSNDINNNERAIQNALFYHLYKKHDNENSPISSFAPTPERSLIYSPSSHIVPHYLCVDKAKTEQNKTGLNRLHELYDKTLSYNLNHISDADFIIAAILEQVLPRTEVKRKYVGMIEVCWMPNIGNNIPQSFYLKYASDVNFSRKDSVDMDNFLSWCIRNKHNYNKHIGNVPELTEWNTILPRYELGILLPACFSDGGPTALPIFLGGKNSNFELIINIRNRLSNLLRMRRKGKDGVWQEIRANTKYLVGFKKEESISLPTLRCEYTTDIGGYKESILCQGVLVQYIREVINLDRDETARLGSTVKIPINKPGLSQAIFVTSSAVSLHKPTSKDTSLVPLNYSNYTTNIYDVKSGYSPIEYIAVKYGDKYKISPMSASALAFRAGGDFLGTPEVNGYNAIALSNAPLSDLVYIPISWPLSELDASLEIKLGDTNPYLMEGDKSDEEEFENSMEESTTDVKNVEVENIFTDINSKISPASSVYDKVMQSKILHEKAINDKVFSVPEDYNVYVRLVTIRRLVFRRKGVDGPWVASFEEEKDLNIEDEIYTNK
ncbi:Divergent Major Capsid Protein [Orpheovirus IHUMI-LCC2]|uniref:Divergent Major Capsid Protein n=1 Tax=Orpheovirus IHUMI-LCC2 TaxID=2023057 RepID=A0A2I2L5V6_9VIRU|nr:Divergent Major Capsid Protein [Orpheovirus IHUMI-LCC2]SNW62938.1 Divergent Major Capsid Protein [Orpheovirus IHUMI-LCC2]